MIPILAEYTPNQVVPDQPKNNIFGEYEKSSNLYIIDRTVDICTIIIQVMYYIRREYAIHHVDKKAKKINSTRFEYQQNSGAHYKFYINQKKKLSFVLIKFIFIKRLYFNF